MKCRNVWDMLIILGIKYINIYIHYTRMKNNNNKWKTKILYQIYKINKEIKHSKKKINHIFSFATIIDYFRSGPGYSIHRSAQ